MDAIFVLKAYFSKKMMMGGVEMIPACTSETYGKLFCPHNKCPYAEEIEVHSKRHYDEYDKYVIAKWRKKSFSLF